MLGWKALELARKHEGLVIIDGKDYEPDRVYLKFDHNILLYREPSHAWDYVEDYNLIKFDDNDWDIVECPHPEKEITKSTDFCTVCEKYFRRKEPKLVTWYRPRIIWRQSSGYPTKFLGDNSFQTSKKLSSWISYPEEYKVLEWETIEAAELWSEVSDG